MLADHHHPDGEASGPVVLMRSPYGRSALFGTMAALMAERGLQVVVQSVRGTIPALPAQGIRLAPGSVRSLMRSSLHAVLRPLLALGLAGLLSTATRDAAACWDGWYAEIGGVDIRRVLDVAEWNPEHARESARWGARIHALLPPGAALSIEWDEATCESDQGACGAVTTIAAGSEDLPAAFRAVAKVFQVPAAKVRKARALEPTLYTVQIFAGSKRRALAVKGHVAALDAGEHGFFVEGGFPATKQTAHVLRDPEARGPHRVIVGTFLRRKEAEAALVGLRAKGFGGYVRTLPAGKAIDEASFTKMG
ncbi:hypothetical protein QHF89_29535 [Polyangium sorediatum]|uniref:Xaa-Pro dipeptidyl-peptidase-like domain-containing protein n=1 Tax=Polyangium sorediatum TaxID=889274 RepID=A0ABT6NZD4_9BACT|nr:CocE/NonD family hydrolase [Polyangium sorediatum]MDI1433678.1 hypothetical protein [Polyangium sorediatum]